MFVDLQDFLVEKQFVVKEFAALKDGFDFWMLRTVKKSHQNRKTSSDVFDWELPWNGRMEWFYSMVRNLITKTVMGTTTTDDKIVVYIKEQEKREWLRDLFLDEARQEDYVENIKVHYET